MSDPTTLLALADRCEREQPSYSLECAIAEAIGAYSTPPRNYTVSLDAAVMLVPEGAEWSLTNLYGVARAELPLNCGEIYPSYGTHKGGLMALALCAAALRARAEMEERP